MAKDDNHQWNWDRAHCMKCGKPDPYDIAMANGAITFEDIETGEVHWRTDEERDAYCREAICHVKGIMKFDPAFEMWELVRPDGSIGFVALKSAFEKNNK